MEREHKINEKQSFLSIPDPTKEKLKLLLKKSKLTWRIFRGNKLGMVGLAILLAFVCIAIFAPQIMWVLSKIGGWTHAYEPFDDVASVGMGTPPSTEHWLGTDTRGNDVLSKVLYGTRISMLVGLTAAGVAMGFGSLFGLLSGHWGGVRDEILMRINDVFLVLPSLVLMIVMAAIIPGGVTVWKIIFIIGITSFSGTARIVRAQVMSVKERAFIERARAIGAQDLYIVRKHIFPNVFPLIFANSVLIIAVSIISESTLSFIGLGPSPTSTVTWGIILQDSLDGAAIENGLFLWIVVPGLCIVFLVLGFMFIGYALDEIFNPKLRKR